MSRKKNIQKEIQPKQETVALNPDWTYGEVQPSCVRTGEAYVVVLNPKYLHLGVKPWCEVKIKKADDAYLKITKASTSKDRAMQIAYNINKDNGIIKNVIVV